MPIDGRRPNRRAFLGGIAPVVAFGGALDDVFVAPPPPVKLAGYIDGAAASTFDVSGFTGAIAPYANEDLVVWRQRPGDRTFDAGAAFAARRLDIGIVKSDDATASVPALAALRLPLAFALPPEADAALARSIVADTLTIQTLERNVRILALWWNGWRTLTSRGAIGGADDLVGKRVGIVPGDAVAQVTFTALGARPVDVPREHRYDRLADGSVDVVEDTLEEIAIGRYAPRFGHVALCDYAAQFAMCAMNARTFAQLPPGPRAGFPAAARAAAGSAIERGRARDAAIVAQLRAAGVAVTAPARGGFAAAAAAVRAGYARTHYPADFLAALAGSPPA